jgi:hypothetical protein
MVCAPRVLSAWGGGCLPLLVSIAQTWLNLRRDHARDEQGLDAADGRVGMTSPIGMIS